MELLEEFWNKNNGKDTIEWGTATPYHNTWQTEPTIIGIENEQMEGGGYPLRAKVANAIRDAMEEWTGMKQAISSVYGIRSYHNGSILTPHVDRLPLVSSAILNVAQDVDEDWPLEVYDHNGVAHNVTMKPGDLVLYESHSVIHGRPFAMKGNYYANIFVHFEPIGPIDASENVEIIHHNMKYPPYLLPDTTWDTEWRDNHPNGWDLLEDAPRLVRDGDLYTIKYSAKINPDIWHGNDDWRPIHEAVRHGHLDVVKYLVLEHHVAINTTCRDYDRTPYSLARGHLGDSHPVTEFLKSLYSEEELLQEYNVVAEPYVPVEEEDEYDEGEGEEYEEDGEELPDEEEEEL
jgi:prolyl 4-hydroxylase